jgi:hypothetical protein
VAWSGVKTQRIGTGLHDNVGSLGPSTLWFVEEHWENGGDMMVIGVDYHPGDPYIAFVDTETGVSVERQLNHSEGEAEKFYRELAARGVSVRVGKEATGYSRWFERLLAELGIEVSIGDAAEIKTERIRKQNTEREANARSDAPPYTTDHRLPEAIFFVARMALHDAGFGNY